ncbi:hypothetical protein BDN72DRAFT_862995 [Pluteus cervinus]|uniref:Uncharacterized protein n=1 Tax=Pluteus cervinus TaxID=181527 RepID=A0ACD3A964_9AGAR|nr:hypothetical protein BDN72DRAFT_862995 [Pluteus cervinus]
MKSFKNHITERDGAQDEFTLPPVLDLPPWSDETRPELPSIINLFNELGIPQPVARRAPLCPKVPPPEEKEKQEEAGAADVHHVHPTTRCQLEGKGVGSPLHGIASNEGGYTEPLCPGPPDPTRPNHYLSIQYQEPPPPPPTEFSPGGVKVCFAICQDYGSQPQSHVTEGRLITFSLPGGRRPKKARKKVDEAGSKDKSIPSIMTKRKKIRIDKENERNSLDVASSGVPSSSLLGLSATAQAPITNDTPQKITKPDEPNVEDPEGDTDEVLEYRNREEMMIDI